MSTQARLIPLALIIEEPDFNPRKDMGKGDGSFLDLVESIRERGLLVPPLVRPTGETYKILSGHRRIAAAREIGLEQVLCVISTASQTDDLPLSLIENLKRKDLSPLEKARGFKRLAEEQGLCNREVARLLGLSHTAVNGHLALLSLPQSTQDMIERGEVQLTAGYMLARLVKEGGTKTEVQALARKAANENLTRDEIAGEVNRLVGSSIPAKLPESFNVAIPLAKKPVVDWALRRYGSLWRALETLQALETGKPGGAGVVSPSAIWGKPGETGEKAVAAVHGTWDDPMTVVKTARAQGWREVLVGGKGMTGELIAVPVGPLPTGYSLIVTIQPSGAVHTPMTCPQRWQTTAKRIASEIDPLHRKRGNS